LRQFPLLSFETSGFIPEKNTAGTSLTVQDQVLARPFIDAESGQPGSLLVASPNLATGTVSVAATSQLWGQENNWTFDINAGRRFRWTVLGGFRYMDLRESLDIHQTTTLFPGRTASFYGTVINGGIIDIHDQFDARNQFYGGQVGFRGSHRCGRWTIDVGCKLAMGNSHKTLLIQGRSSARQSAGDAPNPVFGGLLAVPGNIGRHRHDSFAFLPEGNMQIGFQILPGVSLTMGYNFIYWSRVIRPGEQIDPTISLARVPTSPTFGGAPAADRPRVLFNQSDYWMQGGNFGLTIRY
jgi:hypothetical protein